MKLNRLMKSNVSISLTRSQKKSNNKLISILRLKNNEFKRFKNKTMRWRQKMCIWKKLLVNTRKKFKVWKLRRSLQREWRLRYFRVESEIWSKDIDKKFLMKKSVEFKRLTNLKTLVKSRSKFSHLWFKSLLSEIINNYQNQISNLIRN